MRERKYKAWDKHNKVWVGPYTFKQLVDEDQFSYDREAQAICSKWECFEWVDYTGYKDSKGNEIYGRDLVKFIDSDDAIYQVVWGKFEDCCVEGETWVLQPDIYQRTVCYRCKDLEGIGNAFEHPHMLNKDNTHVGKDEESEEEEV